MSESVIELEKPRAIRVAQAAGQDSDVWVRSYCYVRTAMVGLLLGLGVAVLYQTGLQGWQPLGSVSAYYYTPAQAIFVGGLIGLGACMIALKGTNDVEDVFLNLGGMFAAVVAIVPTSRGEDYQTAVQACQETSDSLTQTASTVDCPTVNALADAARANVNNNTSTLLIVGAIGLAATGLFALRYRRLSRSVAGRLRSPSSPQKFWWGFGAALAVWVAGAVVFLAYTDWFVGHAHYVAAGGLFLCIVVVAMANAFRRKDTLSHVISLFVLEIVVAGLFLAFWMWQTVERLPRPGQAAGR